MEGMSERANESQSVLSGAEVAQAVDRFRDHAICLELKLK
jgi:hypothetical protein